MNSTVLAAEHFQDFTKLTSAFSQCHANPLNLWLHLVTTPFGLVGLFGLVLAWTGSLSVLSACIALYLFGLLSFVSVGEFLGTLAVCGMCLLLAKVAKFSIHTSIFVIVLSYLFQDAAHWVSGEDTFQSKYSGDNGHIDLLNLSGWSKKFSEHCFFLLPLLINSLFRQLSIKFMTSPFSSNVMLLKDSFWVLFPLLVLNIGNYCVDSRNGWNLYPGCPFFSRVMRADVAKDPKEDSESRKNDLAIIRKWTMDMQPSRVESSHWWFKDLPDDVRAAFDRVAKCSQIVKQFRTIFSEQHYCLEVVDGMNEIYVTPPARFDEEFNSDQIFYTNHVDGPYGIFPFASTFRTIVGTDRNLLITTHFPVFEFSVAAQEGDAIIFDYHRELHYITNDESKRHLSDEFRVVLKLHYVTYPRILAPVGWLMIYLSENYNRAFRTLFLVTMHPKTAWDRVLAFNVVFNTHLFNTVETWIGLRNVVFLVFCFTLWYCTGCYEWFLWITSFVHYPRYISTYYIRKGIDFGSFKRDAFFFKNVALIQIFYMYIFPSHTKFAVDYVSLAMIVIGYGVSAQSYKALGTDRTYFGSELGRCAPKWITEFPYGYIPHPMIVAQMFGLIGFLKAEHFRTGPYAYLIHFHVIFYLIHMLQEHFELYHDNVLVWYKRYLGEDTAAEKKTA